MENGESFEFEDLFPEGLEANDAVLVRIERLKALRHELLQERLDISLRYTTNDHDHTLQNALRLNEIDGEIEDIEESLRAYGEILDGS